MSWVMKAREQVEAEQARIREQLSSFTVSFVLDFMWAHGWHVVTYSTDQTVLCAGAWDEKLILFNNNPPSETILRMLETQSKHSDTPLHQVIAELRQARVLRGTLRARAERITPEIKWSFGAWRIFEFEDEPLYVGVIEEELQSLISSGTCSLLVTRDGELYDQELAAFTLLHYSELAETANNFRYDVSLTTALMSTEPT